MDVEGERFHLRGIEETAGEAEGASTARVSAALLAGGMTIRLSRFPMARGRPGTRRRRWDAPVRRADAGWVRDVTGFAIGEELPGGMLTAPIVLMDEGHLPVDPVGPAAG